MSSAASPMVNSLRVGTRHPLFLVFFGARVARSYEAVKEATSAFTFFCRHCGSGATSQ